MNCHKTLLANIPLVLELLFSSQSSLLLDVYSYSTQNNNAVTYRTFYLASPVPCAPPPPQCPSQEGSAFLSAHTRSSSSTAVAKLSFRNSLPLATRTSGLKMLH